MRHRVTIESTRTLFDDVFRIDEAWLSAEQPDGSMGAPMRRLNVERGDSAAALIINRDRRTCILAEQFRFPAHLRGNGWLLEVPAGVVEPGESPPASIQREILEEVGYRAGELIPIATFFPSPGGCSEQISLYCALVGDVDRIAPGGGRQEEGEAIVVREIALAQIDRTIASGQIVDGKTLLALTWLQLRLARGEIL